MTISRIDKEKAIKSTVDLIKPSLSIISCHYVGMKAEDMTKLRAQARIAKVVLLVVGNRLAKIAFKGTAFEAISESFTGSTLLAFSFDAPGSAARLLKSYVKKGQALQIKAISLGDDILGADKLSFVASMPTRDEALSLIAMVVQAPVRNLALGIKDVHGRLARVVSAVAEQKKANA